MVLVVVLQLSNLVIIVIMCVKSNPNAEILLLLSDSDGTTIEQQLECQRHVTRDNMTEDFWLSLIERIYSMRLYIMSLDNCNKSEV